MPNENSGRIDSWLNERLEAKPFDLWRESLEQLRQLHNDIWNGVRFFLTINGIIIAAVIAIITNEGRPILSAILIVALSLLGIFLTIIARSILSKHRLYYLEMLGIKTYIEKEFGFGYQLDTFSLSFPWRITEDKIREFMSAPGIWIRHNTRPKQSITRLLFLCYEMLVLVYVVSIVVTAVWFFI